jgi:hypothetical protein
LAVDSAAFGGCPGPVQRFRGGPAVLGGVVPVHARTRRPKCSSTKRRMQVSRAEHHQVTQHHQGRLPVPGHRERPAGPPRPAAARKAAAAARLAGGLGLATEFGRRTIAPKTGRR